MRFYPTSDPSNFSEIPYGWGLCCHNPNITWKREPLEPKHFISYWRDFEGEKLPKVLKKDLQIKNWSKSRIRSSACLPQYYALGPHFVLLESAPPGSFKCAPLPMNLAEVQQKNMASKAKKKKKVDQKLAKNTTRTNKNLRKN